MSARHRLAAIAVFAVAAFLFVGAAQTSSGTLVVSSNTTLTEDHYGNVVIAADHVTLNGAGHRVIGAGTGTGILVDGHTGVTLANLDVSGFAVGIALVNPAHHAPGVGATIRGSTLHGNGQGLDLDEADTTFAGNVVRDNRGAALLGFHSVGVIARNTIRSNGSGIGGTGVGYDVRDNLIAGNAGAAIAFGGAGTIENNLISDNRGVGIGLATGTCQTCSITGNLIRDNDGSGIALGLDSPGLPIPTRYLVAGNTVIGNAASGIQATFASSNTYRGNRVIGNGGIGFDLYTSIDNVLDHNVANSNGAGFVLRLSSSGNSVTDNVANSNEDDGFAVVSASSFNTISLNVGHANGHLDGVDDGSGTGNVWTRNSFAHTAGL